MVIIVLTIQEWHPPCDTGQTASRDCPTHSARRLRRGLILSPRFEGVRPMKKFLMLSAVLGCVAVFGLAETAQAGHGHRSHSRHRHGSGVSLYVGGGSVGFGYSSGHRHHGSSHYRPRSYGYGHSSYSHRGYNGHGYGHNTYQFPSYNRYHSSRYGFCR